MYISGVAASKIFLYTFLIFIMHYLMLTAAMVLDL